MNKIKVLAIIPARGGSKGIPKKNLFSIAGKPLIAWTIESSKKSQFINATIVSSDNDEILQVAKKYGVIALKRPKKLATDKALSLGFMLHAIKTFQRKNMYLPEIVILLQPTSPLRTYQDIDSAISLISKRKCSAVISVKEVDKKYLKTFIMQGRYLIAAINNNFPFMPRQKLPPIYTSNGAIYVLRTSEFMKHKTFLLHKTVPYVMSDDRSLDLDSPEDIPALEAKLKALIGSAL